MKKFTYQEAYDRIIDAYFKDEIKPMHPKFCFCGTLSPDMHWRLQGNGEYPYSYKEYLRMEEALFGGISCVIPHGAWDESNPSYEVGIYTGMCLALDELKKIHQERGENVGRVPPLKKRILEKV